MKFNVKLKNGDYKSFPFRNFNVHDIDEIDTDICDLGVKWINGNMSLDNLNLLYFIAAKIYEESELKDPDLVWRLNYENQDMDIIQAAAQTSNGFAPIVGDTPMDCAVFILENEEDWAEEELNKLIDKGIIDEDESMEIQEEYDFDAFYDLFGDDFVKVFNCVELPDGWMCLGSNLADFYMKEISEELESVLKSAKE